MSLRVLSLTYHFSTLSNASVLLGRSDFPQVRPIRSRLAANTSLSNGELTGQGTLTNSFRLNDIAFTMHFAQIRKGIGQAAIGDAASARVRVGVGRV